MFTGIVEEIGRVEAIRRGLHSAVLTIGAKTILEDLHVGDSIAVNGICLTAVSFTDHSFSVDVMHETLDRSSLAGLRPGTRVNLERAMAANGRFGGHMVAGHADGVGMVSRVQPDDNAIWYTVEAAPEILRYVVEKGSICMDGISLTVARVTDKDFSVSVIPHTAAVTVLRDRRPGDKINLETDLIGKYVEKLLRPRETTGKPSSVTMEFLMEHGF